MEGKVIVVAVAASGSQGRDLILRKGGRASKKSSSSNPSEESLRHHGIQRRYRCFPRKHSATKNFKRCAQLLIPPVLIHRRPSFQEPTTTSTTDLFAPKQPPIPQLHHQQRPPHTATVPRSPEPPLPHPPLAPKVTYLTPRSS